MPDDELPQSICSNCTIKVQEAFSYKRMCEESDEKLRAYLRNRLECEPKLFDQTDSHEIERIHLNDHLFSRDDLLDENLHEDTNIGGDDDAHDFDGFDNFDDEDGGGNNEDHESSDSEEKIPKSKKSKDETRQSSGGTLPKSQYRLGEDFQLVNKAKQINGRYQCEMCEKTLADRRTFLLHIRLHLGKNLKHCDFCGKGKLQNFMLNFLNAVLWKYQNK